MRSLPKWALAAVLATALVQTAGCARNDLGSTCQLVRPTCVANCDDPDPDNWTVEYPTWEPGDLTRDYVSTGGADCENFTCVQEQGSETPFCSRPCPAPGQNDYCQGGVDENLVCKDVALNDEFMDALCRRLGEEKCAELFPDKTGTYCVHPDE